MIKHTLAICYDLSFQQKIIMVNVLFTFRQSKIPQAKTGQLIETKR
jgi:hypothetical protein